jgi:hypothetical protein
MPLITGRPVLNWSAAVWAGVVAGAAFMIVEMLLVPLLLDGSPWHMPLMIAAIVFGPSVLPPPAIFGLGVFLVAIGVHFALSLAYAATLATAIGRAAPATAALVGIVFGLALYAVNFYLFTYMFPWFAGARNVVTVLAHVVCGALAGYTYRTFGAARPIQFERRAPMI